MIDVLQIACVMSFISSRWESILLNCLEMFSSLWLFLENRPGGSLRMLPVLSVMTGGGIYSIVVRGSLAVLNNR